MLSLKSTPGFFSRGFLCQGFLCSGLGQLCCLLWCVLPLHITPAPWPPMALCQQCWTPSVVQDPPEFKCSLQSSKTEDSGHSQQFRNSIHHVTRGPEGCCTYNISCKASVGGRDSLERNLHLSPLLQPMQNMHNWPHWQYSWFGFKCGLASMHFAIKIMGSDPSCDFVIKQEIGYYKPCFALAIKSVFLPTCLMLSFSLNPVELVLTTQTIVSSCASLLLHSCLFEYLSQWPEAILMFLEKHWIYR